MSTVLAARQQQDTVGSGARRGGEEASSRPAELLENKRRYRETQTELAHANRVATMGQLTASIAHEVNQPIAAALTNAEAALRWLGARPPDLEEVRHALARIVRDTNRAGDVIGRVRQLINKAPPRKGSVDIQQAIHEVIELTRSEALNNGVLVQTNLADGLPLIKGDRVQLQQVLLNLFVNAIQAMARWRMGSETCSSAPLRPHPTACSSR
jgi:C4-dicarboxylate-specific signal transduction histidine kinase